MMYLNTSLTLVFDEVLTRFSFIYFWNFPHSHSGFLIFIIEYIFGEMAWLNTKLTRYLI